jgi:glycosyltransferase involved in cell wall biosynthesis
MVWWCGKLSRRLFLRKLSSGRYDLVLLTSSQYETDFLNYAGGTPFLMVCHDTMRSVAIPGGAIDAWSDPLYRLLYLVRRAARVICVSEATRRDLLQCLPHPIDNLAVVPTGNLLPLWANRGSSVPGLPESYLLFVGSRQVRKNFHGVVRVMASLQHRIPGIKLVCTGLLNPCERDFLESLGIAGSVTGFDVSDTQLVTLYEQALCLVLPSFYEGFGLPILEAMHCGCAVIASKTGAISEVAGDAAILVDPGDQAALSHACERLVNDSELRATLAKAGRRRAGQFSFESMMNEFLKQVETAVRQRMR